MAQAGAGKLLGELAAGGSQKANFGVQVVAGQRAPPREGRARAPSTHLRSPGLLLLVEPEVEASSPPHMAMAAYADFEWSPPTRDLVADSMGV